MYYKYTLLILLSLIIILITGCKTTQVQNKKPPETFYSDDAAVFFNKGMDYHNEEKHEDAVNCFSEAIKISRLYQNAYTARGISYYFLGKFQEAMSDFDHAISLGSQDISHFGLAYFMKGRIYNKRGEYGKAVENYNKADRIISFSADKYNERSYAYYCLGKMAEALADISIAINLSPTNCDYLDSRGAVYYKMKLYKNAFKDFYDSFVLNPGNVNAATCIGTISKDLGHYDVSLEYYNYAIELDPEYIPALKGRGELYVVFAELSDDINEKNEYFEKSKADFKKVR